MKNKKVVSIDEPEKKASKKTERIKVIISIVLVIIVVVLILAFQKYFTIENAKMLLSNVSGFLKGEKVENTAESIDINGGELNEYGMYKKNFVCATTDGLYIYAPDGTETFFSMGMQSPQTVPSEKYLLAYDLNGKKAMIVNYTTNVKEITVDGELICATTSDAGYTAIAYEAEGYKGIVDVYDKNFEMIYRWYSATSNIVSVCLSPSGREMCVLGCSTGSAPISGTITVCDFDKEEPENVMSLNDTLPLDIRYIGGDKWLILTSDKILYMNRKGETVVEYSFDDKEVSLYEISDNGEAIVSFNGRGEYDSTQTIFLDKHGKFEKTVTTDGKVISADCRGNHVVLLTPKSANFFDLSGEYLGQKVTVKNNDNAVLDGSGGCYLINAGAAYYISVE